MKEKKKKKKKRTWTVYSPPWPAESTSKLENFSNICNLKKLNKQLAQQYKKGQYIHKTTHVSSIVRTLRNVQLLIWKSRKNIRYLATGSMPFSKK